MYMWTMNKSTAINALTQILILTYILTLRPSTWATSRWLLATRGRHSTLRRHMRIEIYNTNIYGCDIRAVSGCSTRMFWDFVLRFYRFAAILRHGLRWRECNLNSCLRLTIFLCIFNSNYYTIIFILILVYIMENKPDYLSSVLHRCIKPDVLFWDGIKEVVSKILKMAWNLQHTLINM